MRFLSRLKLLRNALRNAAFFDQNIETSLLLTGHLLAESMKNKSIHTLVDAEFKVFSQWGDDGIIQWLIHNLDFPNKTFIEFGVETYRESNTRFLMMNNNWEGFVMDSSARNISRILSSEFYWKYQLTAKEAYINRDNINDLLRGSGLNKNVGILHIDIDGNDYWIWQSIEAVCPVVVIIEYNSVFGSQRAITVPYDERFDRSKKHYSNLYFGASLPALCYLANTKNYDFVGCNSAGNNAYFIRRDKMNSHFKELTPSQGYILSKSRESRDRSGYLTYITGAARLDAIRGLPVYNVLTNSIELL